jgi:Fe2+ or Zn2+ uptake regulation protein
MNIKLDLPPTLSRRSHHMTRQRQLVLEILKETGGHPDAGVIFQEAKKKDDRISLATVYRSLDYLKRESLVEENSFGEDHGHFETIQDPHHYHFTCIGCGKVIELEGAWIHKMVYASSEAQKLQVTEINIHLRGYCPDCRTKK